MSDLDFPHPRPFEVRCLTFLWVSNIDQTWGWIHTGTFTKFNRFTSYHERYERIFLYCSNIHARNCVSFVPAAPSRCVRVSVVLCSSDWLRCVYSPSASASMSSESRCHVWFDRCNTATTGPFSALNPGCSVDPGNTSTAPTTPSSVIGVDRFNKKSLRWSSDILIGGYSKGCRDSEHTAFWSLQIW